MVKLKERNITKKEIIGTILIFISILIIASIIWGNRTFAVKTLAQIIFHLKVPMSGTDTGIYYDWFIWCVPATLVATIIADLFFFNIYRVCIKKETVSLKIKETVTKKFTWIGVSCLVMSLVFTLVNYNVYGYFTNVIQKTDLYEKYYVDPSTTEISFPNGKRNLVHIYLESIENTYGGAAEGGAYQNSYIPELDALANENINFSNTDKIGGSQTLDGTQWTIAAMVAQEAGIPLLLPIEGNSYGKNSLFLPGSYSLGEVLKKEGYQQEFLSGSDADFAGTSNFYKQHGNYDIVDYNRIKEDKRIPDGYFEFWGFEDEKLFSFAKEDILSMAKEDQPFNMTMVTIDSHTPEGYLSDSCVSKYSSQYENVIACQSSQVNDFVSWIQEQDFYDNTTIVITGDHNSMASKFFEGIDANYIRTPYNVIINSPIQPVQPNNRTFTVMDWYPTILAAMGAEIKGDQLGLGVNLFSDKKTLVEQTGWDYLQSEAQKTSIFYNKEIIGLKE